MNSLGLDEKHVYNSVEEFYTTSDDNGGYVVVISRDNIAQSNIYHHTHGATLKILLDQLGDFFPLDNSENYWRSKQGEGYVLMQMTKEYNIVYMPEYLSQFQFDTVTNIKDQIASYEKNNDSNVIIGVFDGEERHYFNQIAQLKEYLDSKRPHTK